MQEIETFKELVLFCREYGVSRAKFGEIEFVLEEQVEDSFDLEDMEDPSVEEAIGFNLIGVPDE